ncbi:hypothetical protein GALMADRAFT_812565 [Galerina marginata CBS 339.88]|uniref:Secreted protein n=1 Tax=Galerina marginata (strain CBS 339.88) TaxID=685588 RepID=A0A067SVU6_GALM3|nr:hypothetical protein GALMADRAFT_812565 [Galerina marginata CBS 339.88]
MRPPWHCTKIARMLQLLFLHEVCTSRSTLVRVQADKGLTAHPVYRIRVHLSIRQLSAQVLMLSTHQHQETRVRLTTKISTTGAARSCSTSAVRAHQCILAGPERQHGGTEERGKFKMDFVSILSLSTHCRPSAEFKIWIYFWMNSLAEPVSELLRRSHLIRPHWVNFPIACDGICWNIQWLCECARCTERCSYAASGLGIFIS